MIAAMVAGGCAISPSGAEPHELGCRAVIENLDAPPDHYRIIGGVVAFNPDVLQTNRPANDPEERTWAKDGLVIRVDSEFEILAANGQDLTFGWGTTASFGSVLHVPGCESRGWEWQVFAGGWTPKEDGCYDVFVRVDGQIHQTQMAIGAPCAS